MHKTKIASFLHHFCIISQMEAVTKSSGGHVWSRSVMFSHLWSRAPIACVLLVAPERRGKADAPVAQNPLPVKFGKEKVKKQ